MSEFKRITENANSIYEEMTDDLYFLGAAIQRKQRMIYASVGALLLLLLGLAWTTIFTSTTL